jgi:hypothetical protein
MQPGSDEQEDFWELGLVVIDQLIVCFYSRAIVHNRPHLGLNKA